MRPTDLQLLKAIRAGLAQLTHQAALVGQIDIAVGELIARADGRADSVRESYGQAQGLAVRAAALLRAIGDLASAAKADAMPRVGATDLAGINQPYSQLRQLLVELLLPLHAAVSAGAGDARWRADARRFFADLAQLEVQRACDDFAPNPGLAATENQALDIGRLRQYFATWPASTGGLHLIDVRSLSGGFSRETLLAKLRKPSGEDISLILRKQLPGGLLGSSCLNLEGEIPYLELAYGAGLPVAEVLWHERDISVLGGEFIAMSFMPGATLGTPVAAFAAVEEPLLRELAMLLAKLHRTDWRGKADALCPNSGVPVAPQVSSVQAALAMCQAFETMWREGNLGPLPALELVLDWLKRNPPETARPAMLSHGDIGFHNLMGEDGHITALLDWETARLADPAKDLSMVRNIVKAYVPWERFLGWYRDAGGPEIDEASLQYYTVFNAFTHMLVCEIALGARFAQADAPELEYLQLGLPIRAYFARELLRDCAPVWGS